MRTLLILSLVALLSGCGGRITDDKSKYGLHVIVVEGCEYLVAENATTTTSSYSFAITHKGNCNNPIHHGK